MKPIPVGIKGSAALEVKPEHLASCVKDASLPPVLATPVMITVMETAALDAIKPFLEKGETAVGTRVDIHHLSPSEVGMRVIAEAQLMRVDGRRLEFHVSAADESGQIGVGTHERSVTELAHMEQHLAAKRAGRAHLSKINGGE